MSLIGWLLALASNFFPHLTAVALIVLGVALYRRQRLATLAAGLAFTIGSGALLHSAGFSASRDPVAGPTLRVMTFNLLHDNSDMGAVAALILRHDPDIVALQEATREHLEALAGVAARYPARLGEHTQLWSRFPAQRLAPLAAPLRPWRHVLADLDWHGKAVRVFATHMPRPLSPGDDRRQRLTLDHAAGLSPDIALGDFNATRFMPRLQRLLRRAGLHLPPIGPPAGTAPVWLPAPLALRIDHVLTGRCWRVLRQQVDLPAGSNHRPVIAELTPIMAPGCPVWSAGPAPGPDGPQAAAAP